MQSNLPKYRKRCKFNDCERGPFETRKSYIWHLSNEHDPFVARIADQMYSSTCLDCGILFRTRRGRCPSCEGGKGMIRGGVKLDKNGELRGF